MGVGFSARRTPKLDPIHQEWALKEGHQICLENVGLEKKQTTMFLFPRFLSPHPVTLEQLNHTAVRQPWLPGPRSPWFLGACVCTGHLLSYPLQKFMKIFF